MTVLSENVEDLLKRLEGNSKSELNLIRALADAVRQVDDQTLRELRNLSLHHELRRETILGELHLMAARMCQLPSRPASSIRAALDQSALVSKRTTIEPSETLKAEAPRNGADWRQAAQNIQDDLDDTFGAAAPRH